MSSLQLHQEVQRLSRRVVTGLRRCPTGVRDDRVVQGLAGSAPQSNLRGYAAAGLEASLHNLLTRARLWRVLTHCTWEKTTVAMSMPGSKTGRFVSGTHMPLWVDMVAREGEWGGFLVSLLLTKKWRKSVRKIWGGSRASGWQNKWAKWGPNSRTRVQRGSRITEVEDKAKDSVWGGQYLTH